MVREEKNKMAVIKAVFAWTLVVLTPVIAALAVYELWQISWGLSLSCAAWAITAWLVWLEDAIGNE